MPTTDALPHDGEPMMFTLEAFEEVVQKALEYKERADKAEAALSEAIARAEKAEAPRKIRFGLGEVICDTATVGEENFPAVAIEPSGDAPGKVGEKGPDEPLDQLREGSTILELHGKQGALILIEDICSSLSKNGGLNCSQELRGIANKLDGIVPLANDGAPRCSDCVVMPSGRWYCDMKCGPAVESRAALSSLKEPK